MDKILKEENPKLWEALFKSTYRVVRNVFHRVQSHVTLTRKVFTFNTRSQSRYTIISDNTGIQSHMKNNGIPQPGWSFDCYLEIDFL